MKKLKGFGTLLIIGLVVGGAILGVVLFSLLRNNNSDNSEGTQEATTPPEEAVQYTTVSGIIDFSGLKPQGGENGIVRVQYRLFGSGTDYTDTGISVPLADNAKWVWDKAVAGQTYDFRAKLYAADKEITTSNVVTATAPASDEVLVLDVTWEMLPDEIAKEFPVTVSGTARVNGYIPSGAKLVGYGKRADLSDTEYKTGKTFTAAPTVNWAYDEAINGRKYSFYAIMYDANSKVIGTSDIVTKAAPFTDGNITVNSTATAPVQKATISGTVKINGKIESGSEVDIHVRKSGDSDFTTVDSIAAQTNTPWNWGDANSGQQYEIRAVLDIPNSSSDPQSNTSSVTAPASDILLKIDSGMAISSPSQAPTLKECTQDGDQWYAKIKYKGIEGAKKFWVQVGTEQGSSNKKDEKFDSPPANDSLEVKIKTDKDKDYYTRYSYSQCSDCGDSSYSDWSGSLKFKCPQ